LYAIGIADHHAALDLPQDTPYIVDNDPYTADAIARSYATTRPDLILLLPPPDDATSPASDLFPHNAPVRHIDGGDTTIRDAFTMMTTAIAHCALLAGKERLHGHA
jgi:hypothetical protein